MPSFCRSLLVAVLAVSSLAVSLPAAAGGAWAGLDARVGSAVPAAWAARTPGIDESERVVVGNVHPLARPEAAVGRTDPRLPMARIVVALALRPGARARLDTLLAEQQDLL